MPEISTDFSRCIRGFLCTDELMWWRRMQMEIPEVLTFNASDMSGLATEPSVTQEQVEAGIRDISGTTTVRSTRTNLKR